jgi:hypothetical protein
MSKINCWEFKKCGRQPGGGRTEELGICPAAAGSNADGLHGGRNGGRVCWALAGTLCGGEIKGTFARKAGDCLRCDFFADVQKEEGRELLSVQEIHRLL